MLVIDACGVGALPDARDYGDEGTNTLAHLAEALGGLQLPTLGALGLGSIVPVRGVAPAADPVIHGRLHPLGPGKDSITGHWELMGVVLEQPLPTYPDGFPPPVIERLKAVIGRGVICNRPYNGIAAIEDFGAEHLRTGALILYTSQDSVLQLAAHLDRLPEAELHRVCALVREAMSGEHGVGRVIARPFAGREGVFVRTEGRRELTLRARSRSYLQELRDAGVEVHGVGKISDLFTGVGITRSHSGATNARALASTDSLAAQLEHGLVFVNLVETDQAYGHRKDIEGFAGALRHLDKWLASHLERMRAEDLLIITADHGVDPAHPGTDHTREHAPLLALTGEMARRRAGGKRSCADQERGVRHDAARGETARHDGPLADVGATVLRWLAGRDAQGLPGESFLGKVAR